MREDLFAALKKITLIASYLEAKAQLGEHGSEDPKFAPRHLEAAADTLKEAESVLFEFLAELPDDQETSAADTEAELRAQIEAMGDDAPTKFAKALREDPGKVKAFIDSLPDPDMSPVGAEIDHVGILCMECLTDEEKQATSGENPQYGLISRDEADEQRWKCVRCGKNL